MNATTGFQILEKHTHTPAKSLMRMLGPKGSPSAENLSSMTVPQRTEGVRFSVHAAPERAQDETCEMLDRRYDDLKNGRVKSIDGEAFVGSLRQREEELLKSAS